MLALWSSGLNLQELIEKSVKSWIKDKYDYFIELKNEKLGKIDDTIRFTSKGYAVFDEIFGSLL